MKINEQEILNVSGLDPEERYQYFIKRICDWEVIWVMYNEESGYALNVDTLDQKYLYLFPNETFTQLYINADVEFHEFQPTRIDLHEFKDSLVAKFKAKGVHLALVFPVANGYGLNVELDTICKNIDEEIDEHY